MSTKTTEGAQSTGEGEQKVAKALSVAEVRERERERPPTDRTLSVQISGRVAPRVNVVDDVNESSGKHPSSPTMSKKPIESSSRYISFRSRRQNFLLFFHRAATGGKDPTGRYE